VSDLGDELRSSPATAQAAPPARPRRRRSIARRSIAGLSAAGLAATVVLTSAAGSGAATAGRPVPVRAGTTLTGTTSSAAGVMGLQVRYVAPRGKAAFRSLAFTGHSRIALRRASLIFVLAPALPWVVKGSAGAATIRVKPGPRVIIIALKLRPGTHNFAGSLPRRVLATLSRAGRPVPGQTLSMTLTTALSRHHRVRVFRPVMQVGLELSPTIF
jgi:hypothetical protein